MSTVIFLSKGKLYTQSDAIIELGTILGGVVAALVLLKIIPRFIRDAIYRIIASNRNKVSCVILPRDERFLK